MPLLRRRKLDSALKDAYWLVVRDCLVELFEVPAPDAQGLVSRFRARLEAAPKSARHDVIYHEQPFNYAESLSHAPGLAKKSPPPSLDDPQTQRDYDALFARHGLV